MAVAAALDGAVTCGSPAIEVTAVGVPVARAGGVPPTAPRSKTTTRMGRAARAAAMPTTRLTGPARLVVQRGEGPLPVPGRRWRRRAAAVALRPGLPAGGSCPQTPAGTSTASGDLAGGARARDRVRPPDMHAVGELLRGEDVRAAAGRTLGHGGEGHVAGLLVRYSRDLKCLTSSARRRRYRSQKPVRCQQGLLRTFTVG